ncbi:hypothetical protein [Winogradskyella sp.]|nr:hypothetical protein [Winogradskyella sp.]MBT8244222.1 hypothetical protein [Winogradskyella sp.]
MEATIKQKLATFYSTTNTLKANFENILNFFNSRIPMQMQRLLTLK